MNSFSPPLVSIIIPTYNHAHFLPTALNSLISQTFINWEAFVINNFSADDTISIVKSFKDPRIKLYNFANNGIIAKARNYGLLLSTAPFIAFLDSDDYWYPTKLAICLKKLELDYDLVCHGEVWCGPRKIRRKVYYGPVNRATYQSLLFDGNCISTSAVVVSHDWLRKVKGFSEQKEFVTAEDYDLWLKLARSGARIGFVNELLGEYLIHENNQSRVALRNMQATMKVFEHHYSALEDPPSAKRLQKREALILYSGGRSLQSSGQCWNAWPYLFKAINCYPWELRFYIAIILNLIGCFRFGVN